jgi:hypothetical protein
MKELNHYRDILMKTVEWIKKKEEIWQ